METILASFSIDDFRCLNQKDGAGVQKVMTQIQSIYNQKYPKGLSPQDLNYADRSNSELAMLSYTSGTTGFSKGVMLSGNNLAGNITFGFNTKLLHKKSRVLSFLPLAPAYGCAFDFLVGTCSGSHIYFLNKIPSPKVLVKAFEVTVPVPGYHMVYNALAAACVGAQSGLTSVQIQTGISKLKTIAGRNNIIKTDKYTIIDDCYNANPVSMKASVDVVNMALGRKVCILGSMFELGSDEKNLHYDVGQYIGTRNIDVLITIGELAKHIAMGAADYKETHYEAYECDIHSYETIDDFEKEAGSIIKNGDSILIKASHAMNFDRIVTMLSEQ